MGSGEKKERFGSRLAASSPNGWTRLSQVWAATGATRAAAFLEVDLRRAEGISREFLGESPGWADPVRFYGQR